jgi:predicted secreted Zn-dependent protease
MQAPHITTPASKVALFTAPETETTPVETPPVTPNPPAPAAAPSAVALPQDCTRATYSLPTQINLSNQPNGLSQVIDAPTYYQVFGNTPAQIKAQLHRCAPLVNSTGNTTFSAETGSTLAWQYNSTYFNEGTCTISNVKVGLHLNMILPLWQPSGLEDRGLAGKWQNLIGSLTVHENGHIAIYQQYAQQLLNDFQSLPATDCASIAATVAAKAAANIAALDAAHKAYDADTKHGVSQGAVLR